VKFLKNKQRRFSGCSKIRVFKRPILRFDVRPFVPVERDFPGFRRQLLSFLLAGQRDEQRKNLFAGLGGVYLEFRFYRRGFSLALLLDLRTSAGIVETGSEGRQFADRFAERRKNRIMQ
jgi:hypothetical protein